MSFIKDFFSFEVKQTLEQPEERAKSFENLLEGRQEVQEAQRIYADMSIKPKYRYQHLRMNPFYEQRNTMFPHKKFVRRDDSQ